MLHLSKIRQMPGDFEAKIALLTGSVQPNIRSGLADSPMCITTLPDIRQIPGAFIGNGPFGATSATRNAAATGWSGPKFHVVEEQTISPPSEGPRPTGTAHEVAPILRPLKTFALRFYKNARRAMRRSAA
jgi:hypothetical protein